MKISVNGKEEKIELENEKALLSSTLEFLGYKKNTVVVEVIYFNHHSIFLIT